MADTNASSDFDPNDDKRFSQNSIFMNIVRINGAADQMEREVNDFLWREVDGEGYLKMHSILAMAIFIKNLSGEILDNDGVITVTPP